MRFVGLMSHTGALACLAAGWSLGSSALPLYGAPIAVAVDADICYHGDRMVIHLPVTFSGNENSLETRTLLKQLVQQAWSGPFGPWRVKINVYESTSPSANKINIDSSSKNSPHVEGCSTMYVSGNHARDPKILADEVGHLLGLPHTSGGIPGVPDHPSVRAIDTIANNASDPNRPCVKRDCRQLWEGTLRADVTVAAASGRCTGTWQATVEIIVGEDGEASGWITVVDAPNNSCGSSTYAIVDTRWHIVGNVNDDGFTFPASEFVGGQGQGFAFIKKSARDQARDTANTQYNLAGGWTHSFVLHFDLSCKTCEQ